MWSCFWDGTKHLSSEAKQASKVPYCCHGRWWSFASAKGLSLWTPNSEKKRINPKSSFDGFKKGSTSLHSQNTSEAQRRKQKQQMSFPEAGPHVPGFAHPKHLLSLEEIKKFEKLEGSIPREEEPVPWSGDFVGWVGRADVNPGLVGRISTTWIFHRRVVYSYSQKMCLVFLTVGATAAGNVIAVFRV